MRIHFGSIYLNKGVHAQGLGFTLCLYAFVYAPDTAAATQALALYYTARGCDVRKIDVRDDQSATEQHVRAYAFIEQIVDLPDELLQAEYERRNYPQGWRRPGASSTSTREIAA